MSRFFDKCEKDVELAPYATFKIGGKADYFFVAKNVDDLVEAVKAAKDKGIDYYILSGGSNVLISDEGFRGLVILVKSSKLKVQSLLVEADAGVLLMKLVNFALENDLCGLEFSAGIPGTVGGAICGNAGAYGKEIKDYLESVEYLDLGDLEVTEKSVEDLDFKYRWSEFKNEKNRFILSVKFKLERCDDVEKAREEVKKILANRGERIPKEASAGCVFKNLTTNLTQIYDRLDTDNTNVEKFRKYGKIPAGWLIEKCGLKGEQIGGAKVSDLHANFIVNVGGAKASDVIELIKLIKLRVKEKFEVELELEIVLVGFEKRKKPLG